MEPVYRYFAAMYASRAVPQYAKECRHVVACMQNNAYFTSYNLPYDKTKGHIEDLDAAELATIDGPRSAISVRNTALIVVQGDMRLFKSTVQLAADADMTHAKEIIESAGMYVVPKAKVDKPELSARYGGSSGEVLLYAKAFTGRGTYHWQMGNGTTWTDLPPTVTASTRVGGLTPATIYAFRFRSFTKAGFSPWSTAITVIAH